MIKSDNTSTLNKHCTASRVSYIQHFHSHTLDKAAVTMRVAIELTTKPAEITYNNK